MVAWNESGRHCVNVMCKMEEQKRSYNNMKMSIGLWKEI